LGYVVKYLGHSVLDGKRDVYTTVEPVLFKEVSMMSNVNSEFNIISITGDIIGELQFYGKGAGKDATANAVVGDVLYILNIVGEENLPKPLRLNRQLNKMGTGIFKGKYYLRANIDAEENLDQVLTAVETVASRKTVIVNGNSVYVVTSPIAASDFNEMAEKLRESVPEIFYARIYE